MLEELTGINREEVRKMLGEGLKRKCVRSFGSSFVKPDQKLHCAASSVEFVETIDGDRNVLKGIVTGEEIWCSVYDPETKRQNAAWLSQK
jgi:hypothetical protein